VIQASRPSGVYGAIDFFEVVPIYLPLGEGGVEDLSISGLGRLLLPLPDHLLLPL
jgi:hypothetical protein